jgi:Uma2 family endonuclease
VTRTNAAVELDNVAELVERLGDVPLERILLRPAPGTATERDVLAAWGGPWRRPCELVEGTLVEKARGTRESLLAGLIVHRLWGYLEQNDLGQVLGAGGMLRLTPGVVRVPDLSFIAWENWQAEEENDRVADLVPDLAVEVLREGNTPKELERKLREYFLAGTNRVWVIDPRKETAQVYRAPDEVKRVGKSGHLDGEDFLPGFRVSLRELFALADEEAPEN